MPYAAYMPCHAIVLPSSCHRSPSTLLSHYGAIGLLMAHQSHPMATHRVPSVYHRCTIGAEAGTATFASHWVTVNPSNHTKTILPLPHHHHTCSHFSKLRICLCPPHPQIFSGLYKWRVPLDVASPSYCLIHAIKILKICFFFAYICYQPTNL